MVSVGGGGYGGDGCRGNGVGVDGRVGAVALAEAGLGTGAELGLVDGEGGGGEEREEEQEEGGRAHGGGERMDGGGFGGRAREVVSWALKECHAHASGSALMSWCEQGGPERHVAREPVVSSRLFRFDSFAQSYLRSALPSLSATIASLK